MYFIVAGIGLFAVIILGSIIEGIRRDHDLDMQCQREYAESLRHSQD